MSELVNKFNLYDHLGYILVGFYQICILWVLYILASKGNFDSFFNFLKLEFTVALIMGAYLVGHLVQVISNIFEKWEKRKKEEKRKELDFVIKKARKFFNLPADLPEKVVWQYCYIYALSNDFSGHVVLFNSMHSLYRGFWIASLVGFIGSIFVLFGQSTVYLVGKFTIVPDWRILFFVLITFSFGALFNRRKKRFFEYMNEKTLVTFDILSKNLLIKK